MRRFWPLLAVLLWALFTFGPLLSVLVASAVATANGCALDEGSIHPCVIAGWNAGGLLYTLGVLGWLMLLTLPVGAVVGAVGGVLWLVWWGRRKWVRDR
ncbi:hypothetical protein E5F05_06160 [Deinococcus metallilatus]|uniref:Uncharacterized protein n=1 Tax=Deinococcus metallilatus TaxID=1211322 RepID=A0AAJ5F6E5_9DEIO|nr:hypothetical protein [Deinococcus metallilatus]MBB5294525.1 hypothetical protein [Deinococcus metallilatus]QBY07572.1 hypothetical protein E5F05_06160 [Deinococcus metallilatus]RXJ13988.1 hypothetical protein ERJ73_04995 [Deinococcus metallilatus]TLK29953.1 hypothetical protein FCS05_05310 [Deinococcus metallilatus]GMA15739.1 hypothetical protein GCM10025871_20700 [Deinococcus metallilatus]